MGVDRCIIYLVVLLEILACSLVTATDLSDVIAINNLYGALKSPPLHGWRPSAGDPCGESWQGVICDATNTHIMSITVHGTNLGGELGDSLGAFSSLQSIDLSNNAIRGSFPAYLPVTIINLDLSCNFLSGQLPSSLASLSSLRTFQLQNNQLSGTLHVLQDLLLHDLNVDNNLFIGPIPDKLLTIPNFRYEGNSFITGSPVSFPPAGEQVPLQPGTPSSSKKPWIYDLLYVIGFACVFLVAGMLICWEIMSR